MRFWVCKTCGRALRADCRPNYCYADRMDHIEEINAEDAVRMELFGLVGFQRRGAFVFEFPGDIKFHPVTGDHMPSYLSELRLLDYQKVKMQRMLND